jgi:hypothetical protein
MDRATIQLTLVGGEIVVLDLCHDPLLPLFSSMFDCSLYNKRKDTATNNEHNAENQDHTRLLPSPTPLGEPIGDAVIASGQCSSDSWHDKIPYMVD